MVTNSRDHGWLGWPVQRFEPSGGSHVTEQKQPPLPHDFHPPVASFQVVSDDVSEGGRLRAEQQYAKGNVSPHLRWEGFPRRPGASP